MFSPPPSSRGQGPLELELQAIIVWVDEPPLRVVAERLISSVDEPQKWMHNTH